MKTRTLTMQLACAGMLCLLVWSGLPRLMAAHAEQSDSTTQRATASQWMCPMHPDVVSDRPGSCPKCAMALVDRTAVEVMPYDVELATSPAAVKAHEPFTLSLTVRHPTTGAKVSAFELVHEMWFHLFIVSADMTVFQHIHPDMRPDGTWTIDVVLPSRGTYGVLSDFVPVGGAPQMVKRTLVTSDADAGADVPPLAVDTRLKKSADDITAELTFGSEPVVAEAPTRMTYVLTDTMTGEPVVDLQPYLGAFGHTLVVREGLSDYLHSHPPGDDLRLLRPRPRGGPEVTFDAYFDQPGRYRAWTQFQRNGRITTVSFTFDVSDSPRNARGAGAVTSGR